MGWIGVDLDQTLAIYESGDIKKYGVEHIGQPIPAMLERVKTWIENGQEVRIFTARVARYKGQTPHEYFKINLAIKKWCLEHVGHILPLTCSKDFHCLEIWDDRAIQVVANTGERVGNHMVGELPSEAAALVMENKA
jgi:hypothetical protein